MKIEKKVLNEALRMLTNYLAQHRNLLPIQPNKYLSKKAPNGSDFFYLRLGHLSYKVKKRLEKLVFSHYFIVNHNLK